MVQGAVTQGAALAQECLVLSATGLHMEHNPFWHKNLLPGGIWSSIQLAEPLLIRYNFSSCFMCSSIRVPEY